METLFQKLKEEGGAIVSTKDCTPLEIAMAQTEGRMFVDEAGCGFILRPAVWLNAVNQMAENFNKSLAQFASLFD